MVSIWNAVFLSTVSSAMRYSAQAAIWLWRFSVPLTIRPPTIDELSGLSDLCFRSKAVWGTPRSSWKRVAVSCRLSRAIWD